MNRRKLHDQNVFDLRARLGGTAQGNAIHHAAIGMHWPTFRDLEVALTGSVDFALYLREDIG